ncbi:hypothetical protein D9M68_915320 [compost metagenome]
MHEPDARQGLEILACQVYRRTVACRAIGQLAGLRFGLAQQIFRRADSAVVANQHHIWRPAEQRYRLEGLDAAVRQLDANAGDD